MADININIDFTGIKSIDELVSKFNQLDKVAANINKNLNINLSGITEDTFKKHALEYRR